MITRAEDYVFTDVSGIAVSGDILPAVEDGKAQALIRREDLACLAEMCRERENWRNPSGWRLVDGAWTPTRDVPVQSFSPHDQLLMRQPLQQIANSACLLAAVDATLSQSVNNRIPNDAILPRSIEWLDWDDTARDYLRQGLSFEPALRTIHRINKADDLRFLYHDLALIKRFWLDGTLNGRDGQGGFKTFSAFALLFDATANFYGFRYHFLGPFAPDGTTTTIRQTDYLRNDPPVVRENTQSGFSYLACQMTWDADGFQSRKVEWINPTGYLLITKRFGKNLRTGAPALANNLNAWVSFSVTADAYESQTVKKRLVWPIDITRVNVDLSACGGFADAAYSFPFTSLTDSAAFLAFVMQWANREVPGFSSKKHQITIEQDGIEIDSGIVTMNSEIDSLGHYEIENDKPLWHPAE